MVRASASPRTFRVDEMNGSSAVYNELRRVGMRVAARDDLRFAEGPALID